VSEQVEIYIGDVQLPTRDLRNPGQGGDLVDVASAKLAAIGTKIASLFAAMRPDSSIFEGDQGAEGFEVEVGFSVEVGPGGALKLILSPKVGMSCKAKMTWKK
jgi:hypothetical protein